MSSPSTTAVSGRTCTLELTRTPQSWVLAMLRKMGITGKLQVRQRIQVPSRLTRKQCDDLRIVGEFIGPHPTIIRDVKVRRSLGDDEELFVIDSDFPNDPLSRRNLGVALGWSAAGQILGPGRTLVIRTTRLSSKGRKWLEEIGTFVIT